MSKESWYKRKHQFTPYTKADGQAVSDEFDAIQSSFERIPEMRDDGKGFKESPLIPEPTDPMHPVPLKMLTETEKSVNNARDDVTTKAQQVAQNTQSVATNTLTATQKADTATQAAASAQSSQQAASNSENMAHKWAANPVNEAVQGDKYSAYHYATKAAQSETTASLAAITSKNNADIATSKAEEAVQAAEKAKSLANGEIEYEKILNVPSAGTQTQGIVQLTSSLTSDSEELGLTAKVGKYLASLIAKIPESLTGYIKTSSMSSLVDSDSTETVATSKAVKLLNEAVKDKLDKSGGEISGKLELSDLEIVNGDSYGRIKVGESAYIMDVYQAESIGVKGVTNDREGYIAFGNSNNRFGYDGDKFIADGYLEVPQVGHGSYSNQYNLKAPYVVASAGVTRDTYHPFIKGFINRNGEYGSAFSFGYTSVQGAERGFGRGIINLIEDNGHNLIWQFEHNGDFVSNGDVRTPSRSLNKTHQTDFDFVRVVQNDHYFGGLEVLRKQNNKLARFEFNNNRWKLWVQDAYEILFPERGGVVALAHETVSDVRLGNPIYRSEFDSVPTGALVMTGARVQNNTRTLTYRPIQKLVNGTWYNITG